MTLRDALLVLGLVSAGCAQAGCAQIDGKADELDQSAGGARGGDSESNDGSAAEAGTEKPDDASAAASDASESADGSLGQPAADAGMSLPDAGDPDIDDTPDAGSPVTPKTADGTCAAPFELTFSSNRVIVTGNTSGGTETLSPKCLPSGPGVTPVAGPDHVYHFRMPFKGRVSVNAKNEGSYAASVYLLNACGNAATEKACNYAGALSYDVNAGEELFLYIDSGAKSATAERAGAYEVAVTLREQSAGGGACGNGTTDPYCGTGLFCQDEGLGGVCRTGNPETCATAVPLFFRQTPEGRVAKVFGSTVGAKDDVVPKCPTTPAPAAKALGVDHVYSFTLSTAGSIRISLQPGAGYDAVFALLRSACSNVAEALCVDDAVAGNTEASGFTAPAGTYYIVVDAFSASLDSSGSYDLTVTQLP